MTPRSRNVPVARPWKRSEYEIIFISRQAEQGWRDALATFRNAIVDAWERLTIDPTHEDGTRVYQLRGDLATGTYEGRDFDRFQYKFSDGGRIWYFIDPSTTKGPKTAGRVLIERCTTSHPKETE